MTGTPALVLTGGGARAASQLGVLAGLARRERGEGPKLLARRALTVAGISTALVVPVHHSRTLPR